MYPADDDEVRIRLAIRTIQEITARMRDRLEHSRSLLEGAQRLHYLPTAPTRLPPTPARRGHGT